MGSKIKNRQMKKPRNMTVLDAIVNHKGGPMRDRRDRRSLERDDVRRHTSEWNDSSSDCDDNEYDKWSSIE